MKRSCRMFFLICHVILTAWWLGVSTAGADVKLPAIFSDNMVLQRDMPVPVWGCAAAGEEVTVTIAGQTKKAAPDASGKWRLTLEALKTSDNPCTMVVSGKNTLTLSNVLVGEVWIGSGQSNMQMAVISSNNAKEEIAAANYPKIRLISVPIKGASEPQDNFTGKWVECSPATVGHFSAAEYFFGRELQKTLNVPIGLIHCSWGGSSCEAWTKRSVLEGNPLYEPMLARYDKAVAAYDPEKAKAAHEKRVVDWKKAAEAAKAANKKAPYPPHFAGDPRTGNQRAANLYNGMLHAVIPYAIRGAIWYQGESNAGRAYQYRQLFPLMIQTWRTDWHQGDFPFLFVQLANFMAVKPEPAQSNWAELREAQSMTLKLPNTGQAVIIDIGDAVDIHPKNKQDVGKRLALWALAKTYGKDLVYSGPMYRSMEKQDGQIVLHFDHVGGGLVAKGGEKLTGFAVAGEDKKFVWAEAKIVGDTLVVSSPKVKDPVAVRYAWADNPICNLYNKADLPASPFRTDDWPGLTVNSR